MCSERRCSCFSKAGLRVTIASRGRRATMRWCVSIGAVLVAGARAGNAAGIAAPNPSNRLADKDAAASVDVELVLAVDVSYSMDMDELAIQREGYAQAIVSKDFLQALRAVPGSKVAVTPAAACCSVIWSMSPMKRCLAAFAIAASLFVPFAHANDALEAKLRAYVPVFSLAKVCDITINDATSGDHRAMLETVKSEPNAENLAYRLHYETQTPY